MHDSGAGDKNVGVGGIHLSLRLAERKVASGGEEKTREHVGLLEASVSERAGQLDQIWLRYQVKRKALH